MKKIYIILMLGLICVTSMFSYSKNKQVVIQGYIHSYGSDPFVFPGIETNKGKKYGLIADDDVLKQLLLNQGKEIEIEGFVLKQDAENFNPKALKDGTFRVENWQVKE